MPVKHFFTLLAVAICGLATSSAKADIVASSFDFDEGSAAQTGGEMTATDFTAGGWTSGTGGHDISGSSNVTFARTNATGATTPDGNTLAGAIAAESYYGFTLTNSAGVDRDLDTVGFNYWFTNGANTGDYRIYAMSSLAGFTDGSEHGFGQITGNSRPTAGDQVFESFDISSLGTLAAGSAVDFRFYFVDNATNNNLIHRLDDVTVEVDAVTAIPEPSSLAILGIAGLGLVFRRRRN